MKQIIRDVLDDVSNSQMDLASVTVRETVSSLISAALKTKGSYKEYIDYELDEQKARATWVCSICGKNTYDVDWDYIGSGTNHLGCELKLEMKDKDKINLKNQIYTEMTADGLPPGGDVEAVLESKKLAEQIIKAQEGSWIYESPDGGETIYRREFGSDEREEIKIEKVKK